MAKPQRIGIAIVTYNNSEEDLNRLLKSVELTVAQAKDANLLDETVLLVRDNGKKSNIALESMRVVYDSQRENVGYPSGMQSLYQIGFEDYGLDAIVSANPDGCFHYRCLEWLLQVWKLHPKDIIEAAQFPEEHPKAYNPKTRETDWASGCCMLLSKFLYGKTGGLDTHFFLYVEDVDLSWRVRLAGHRIRFVPEAHYGHFVLNRKPNPFAVQCMYESGRYFAYKWRDKKFQKTCEENLVKEGFYKSRRQLPKLKSPRINAVASLRAIKNFSTGFHFSKARWGL